MSPAEHDDRVAAQAAAARDAMTNDDYQTVLRLAATDGVDALGGF